MAKDPILLPDARLVEIQNDIVKHFAALNRSGKLTSTNVGAKEALRALGFSSDARYVEQWLCGADGNCGVKTA